MRPTYDGHDLTPPPIPAPDFGGILNGLLAEFGRAVTTPPATLGPDSHVMLNPDGTVARVIKPSDPLPLLGMIPDDGKFCGTPREMDFREVGTDAKARLAEGYSLTMLDFECPAGPANMEAELGVRVTNAGRHPIVGQVVIPPGGSADFTVADGGRLIPVAVSDGGAVIPLDEVVYADAPVVVTGPPAAQ